jgi:hypothetical protein
MDNIDQFDFIKMLCQLDQNVKRFHQDGQRSHRQTAFPPTESVPTDRQRSHRQAAFPQTNSVPTDIQRSQ